MSPKRTIQKILVANRGEIAVRVMRTCAEMGIRTAAVYSDADRGSLHVRKADEAVHLGPAPALESYLSVEKIVDAARKVGADAVHPGYGFLSERAELARALDRAGIAFVGPPPEAIEAVADKIAGRKAMAAAGVPTVPGSAAPIPDEAEARTFADELGYPVLVKAAAGGGGRGMRRCDRSEDFPAVWEAARREAEVAFGDDRLYLEKLLAGTRHVEVQVFADAHGRCIHLGERECSVQRRRQKVIEESPSPIVDPALRERLGAVAVRAAQAVGYVGAGTVELLVDAQRGFHFLEMNARLQVEHPVTEMITGLDLVRMQIEVARGEPILAQDEVVRRGHAIEARVYAEDPEAGFAPSAGKITYLRVPGGPGVRDDSGVYGGWVIPPDYDPLVSQVVAWAPTRGEAIARLVRALGEYTVHGVTSNIPWLTAVLEHPAFRSGDYDTSFCERHERALLRGPERRFEEVALIAAAISAFQRDRDEAKAFAARAGRGVERSGWARLGRARALRGGGRA
jgi:acetyl-CoA carboxylase biotin carboxylase subunit